VGIPKYYYYYYYYYYYNYCCCCFKNKNMEKGDKKKI
jgi:hypothetical protein